MLKLLNRLKKYIFLDPASVEIREHIGYNQLYKEACDQEIKHLQEEEEMDKQIHKVQRDLRRANKDTKKLEMMDKKFDKEIDKAEKVLKKKKKKSKHE